jgi:ornithine carbamoyltransferase
MLGKRDLLSIADITPDETSHIIRRALQMKAKDSGLPLRGKKCALLFEKPSLRTRVSFEVGIHELGGYSLYLSPQEVGLGSREPVSDVARVLSGYVDCVIARVFSHAHLEEMAHYASIPVINALSDLEHPCQTIADMLTVAEVKGGADGRKLAFIGDGNNVARSLCLGLPAVGMSFAIASPQGYALDDASLAAGRDRATNEDTEVLSLTDPAEAVQGADLVYTDVWASMGDEDEAEVRQRAFQGYTVDPELLARAKPDASFMHDMPAHYGEEVPPGMLEHPQSVAYRQAHNRLHGQKALLEFLLGNN